MTIFGDRIYTIRLLLRKVKESDLTFLAQWSESGIANGDYLTPECVSEQRLREQLKTGTLWNYSNKLFVIETRDGVAIGTLHYWLRPEAPDTAVMALKVAEPAERGKGYGTEAQKYLIKFLFDRLDVRGVEMYTDINNLAQQRCLSKLGFELVDSLTYSDHQVERTGHLYRLRKEQYTDNLIYQHHYA